MTKRIVHANLTRNQYEFLNKKMDEWGIASRSLAIEKIILEYSKEIPQVIEKKKKASVPRCPCCGERMAVMRAGDWVHKKWQGN